MLRQALHRTSRAFSGLDASKLRIEKCATPTTPPANDALVGRWGRVFSPHLLKVDWTASDGWSTPRIQPHEPLQLSPAAMTLHYALQCFEGMKVYRGDDETIRLFRPDLNARRMTSSLQRLAMPTFDELEFVELLKRFVEVERDWVPRGEGHSMYLRPTCVATDPFLGVGVPQEATLYVIASPVGPYFPDGFKPITVVADTVNVRAWPGGAGDTKIGGNYAPTIKPVLDASAATDGRAQQVLFLFGDDHRVTEVGSMNVFVVLRTASGVELVTAPLSGDILPGVTRRSILDLARADPASVGVDVVSERAFTMPEVVAASRDGRLLEVFGAGTAAVVCPVREVVYEGASIDVPTGGDAGPVASELWRRLSDAHYGRDASSDWAVPIN